MAILERLLNKSQGEWFDSRYYNSADPSKSTLQNPVVPALPNQDSSSDSQNIQPTQAKNPSNIQNSVTGPVNLSNTPADSSGERQILQGDGVDGVSVPQNQGISGENMEYLKGLGFSPEDIQSVAAGYSPEKGGFFQQLYESTMRKPKELDENQIKRLKGQSSVIDALGLVAQLVAAAGGGDTRERKLSETATGMGVNAERDLRNTYRQMLDQYNSGLYSSVGQDYKTGYNKYLANRKAILSALENKRKGEQQMSLENLKNENSTNRIIIQEEGRNKRNDDNNRARRETVEYTQGEIAKRNAYNQSQQNARAAASRAGVQRRFDTNQERLRNAKGRSGTNKDKRILFPTSQGMPGSTVDAKTGQSYIPLDLTPDEFSILAQTAKSALSNSDARIRAGLTKEAVSKLKDDEAIRLYVQNENPDILYSGNGNMPMKAFRELLKNPNSGMFYSPQSVNANIGNIPAMIEQDMQMLNSMSLDEVADMAYKDLPFKQATGMRKSPKETDLQFKSRIATAYKEWYSNPESWEDEIPEPDITDEYDTGDYLIQ
ncbi:MAG: hypothetical protein LBV72_00620 [Tannerella sp.]|jgi:hypothetical protein|nr:hypothetical protein [Tannerella sp.]